MPTVSVVVNEAYNTHALLDSGSTNSFITSDAVKCLGLSGKTVNYRHSTVDTLCRVCYLARARAMARVVLAQIEFARAICGSRKLLPMLQ